MRKLIILAAAFILLTGCSLTSKEVKAYDGSPGYIRTGTSTSRFDTLTDIETKCQYIVYSQGALYPRMGADGKQICK